MKTNMMKVAMKSRRRAESLLKEVAMERRKSTATAMRPKQPKERAERMAMKRVAFYFCFLITKI